jgi:oligoendopeptidase F
MRSHPQVHDANPAGGHNQFGDLPEWDLSDLYPSPDGPEITKDMDWLDTACADFANDYEGKLDTLDAAGLLAAVQRY